eukprot:Amastigsp_a841231_77.p2 type:complete len:363 gc:universal Amastigsp_a841231_77:440-1528(+)
MCRWRDAISDGLTTLRNSTRSLRRPSCLQRMTIEVATGIGGMNHQRLSTNIASVWYKIIRGPESVARKSATARSCRPPGGASMHVRTTTVLSPAIVSAPMKPYVQHFLRHAKSAIVSTSVWSTAELWCLSRENLSEICSPVCDGMHTVEASWRVQRRGVNGESSSAITPKMCTSQKRYARASARSSALTRGTTCTRHRTNCTVTRASEKKPAMRRSQRRARIRCVRLTTASAAESRSSLSTVTSISAAPTPFCIPMTSIRTESACTNRARRNARHASCTADPSNATTALRIRDDSLRFVDESRAERRVGMSRPSWLDACESGRGRPAVVAAISVAFETLSAALRGCCSGAKAPAPETAGSHW